MLHPWIVRRPHAPIGSSADERDRYEGDFRDDKFNGKGSYVWAKKNRYDGEFKANRFDGTGIYKWANSAKFDGMFKDGAQWTGTLTHTDNSVVKYKDGTAVEE